MQREAVSLMRRAGGSLVLLVLVVTGLGGCVGALREQGVLGPLFQELMPPTPGQAARDAFDVYDPDKRRRSVALLSASEFGGQEPYVRTYRLLVDDPDASVRAACLKALGLHGGPQDVPVMVRYLQDANSFVRWEAAQGLQKIYDPAAVPALLRTLTQDEDSDVRMAAAAALGQYPEQRVFDGLVGALDDSDFGVVQAARASLVTLCGYDFSADASLWLIWARKHPEGIFAQRQMYVWQPFQRPRSLLERMQFWKPYQPPGPRAPAGMPVSATIDLSPTS